MNRLVLLRHGESIWNLENRFTGWTDVGLSENGVREAIKSAQLMLREGYTFDIAYTSVLERAIKTLWIVLEEMELMWIPVTKDWRLLDMANNMISLGRIRHIPVVEDEGWWGF